jgi:hypothetical protein
MPGKILLTANVRRFTWMINAETGQVKSWYGRCPVTRLTGTWDQIVIKDKCHWDGLK